MRELAEGIGYLAIAYLCIAVPVWITFWAWWHWTKSKERSHVE